MKNYFYLISFLLFYQVFISKLFSQACKISYVEELRSAGFNVGTPVLIGYVGDQPLFRAVVAGDGKRGKFKKKKPRPAPCPAPTQGYYFEDDEEPGPKSMPDVSLV